MLYISGGRKARIPKPVAIPKELVNIPRFADIDSLVTSQVRMNAILCYKQSLEKLSSSRNNGFQIQALGSLPARHVRPHSCYGRRKLEGAGIKNETRILCQADGSINRVFRTITDPCWPSNCSCLFGILSCSMIRSLTGKYQKGVVDKSREEIG